MLTAGHCFLLGEAVNAYQQPPGETFGTIVRRDNYPTNDFALIGGGGVDHEPKIYVGGSGSHASKWVVGTVASPAANYLLYCKSGATTHEDCGFKLVSGNYLFCQPAGCTPNTFKFEAQEGVQNACHGDSGAPFYRYVDDVYASNVKVLGIVIGGDSACQDFTVIEKWLKIEDAYTVTIMTH